MPIESQGEFNAVANDCAVPGRCYCPPERRARCSFNRFAAALRLRWDEANLSRPTGARQSKAYREAVKREIERMESSQ